MKKLRLTIMIELTTDTDAPESSITEAVLATVNSALSSNVDKHQTIKDGKLSLVRADSL